MVLMIVWLLILIVYLTVIIPIDRWKFSKELRKDLQEAIRRKYEKEEEDEDL